MSKKKKNIKIIKPNVVGHTKKKTDKKIIQKTKKRITKLKNKQFSRKMNKWNYFKPTLDYLDTRLNYYEGELRTYLLHLINPTKHTQNTTEQDVLDLNAAIFTWFNNVPNIFHPLPRTLYCDYISYISFINPEFFGIKSTGDIIRYKFVLNKPIKYTKNIRPQDDTPYNRNKRQLSINIKYFDADRFKDYILLCYTNKRHKFIIDKSKHITLDNGEYLVYICLLRKIRPDDIQKVFQIQVIKKGTNLYSFHSYNKSSIPSWYSLDKSNKLNDPYQVFYKHGDINYEYCNELKDDTEFINLSKCVFLKTAPDDLDDFVSWKMSNKSEIKQYNGELNYIKYYSNNNDKIWDINRGKRLLHEILFKSPNFIDLKYYYGSWLKSNGINKFMYSMGYYQHLNKIYDYEIWFNDPEKYVNKKYVKEIII